MGGPDEWLPPPRRGDGTETGLQPGGLVLIIPHQRLPDQDVFSTALRSGIRWETRTTGTGEFGSQYDNGDDDRDRPGNRGQ